MEGKVLRDVRIVKVTSPSNILLTEVPRRGMPGEAALFQAFSQNLNDFFNDPQTIKQSFTPKEGEVYAGLRPMDKQWYRVRVEHFMDRRIGTTANCYLLDKGVTEPILIHSLRVIPKSLKHTRVPYQVKKCCLHGVRPVTLAISPCAETAVSPCAVWDSSVVIFMKKVFAEASYLKAEIIDENSDGVRMVRLYMDSPQGDVCLNEQLIADGYATAYSADYSDSDSYTSDTMSLSSHDSTQPSQSSDSYMYIPSERSRLSRKKKRGKMFESFTSGNIYAETMADMGMKAATGSNENSSAHKASEVKDAQGLGSQEVSLKPTSLPTVGVSPSPKTSIGAETVGISPYNPDRSGQSPVVLHSSKNNTLGLLNSSSPFRVPPDRSAFDYFKLTIPRQCMTMSDSDTSNASDSSLSRNIQTISKELAHLSNGELGSDAGSMSDVSLVSYNTHANKSLKDTVQDLRNKISSPTSQHAYSENHRTFKRMQNSSIVQDHTTDDNADSVKSSDFSERTINTTPTPGVQNNKKASVKDLSAQEILNSSAFPDQTEISNRTLFPDSEASDTDNFQESLSRFSEHFGKLNVEGKSRKSNPQKSSLELLKELHSHRKHLNKLTDTPGTASDNDSASGISLNSRTSDTQCSSVKESQACSVRGADTAGSYVKIGSVSESEGLPDDILSLNGDAGIDLPLPTISVLDSFELGLGIRDTQNCTVRETKDFERFRTRQDNLQLNHTEVQSDSDLSDSVRPPRRPHAIVASGSASAPLHGSAHHLDIGTASGEFSSNIHMSRRDFNRSTSSSTDVSSQKISRLQTDFSSNESLAGKNKRRLRADCGHDLAELSGGSNVSICAEDLNPNSSCHADWEVSPYNSDKALTNILSQDVESVLASKPRRPKLSTTTGGEKLHSIKSRMLSNSNKSPQFSSKVCFSEEEDSPNRSKEAESSQIISHVNPRNLAMKSILKNAQSAQHTDKQHSTIKATEPLVQPPEPSSSHSSVSGSEKSVAPERSTSQPSKDDSALIQNSAPRHQSGYASDRYIQDSSSQSDQEDLWTTRTKIGNRFISNKLLSQLTASNRVENSRSVVEASGKFGATYRPPDGVLVQGDMVIRPVETLQDVKLHERIITALKLKMKSKDLKAPLLIQAYCWPPILRGRDVIGIAPRNTGHILAYLAPLLTQIIEAQPYPPGGGPLAVVICSTWRRAQHVQSTCEALLTDLARPRVMTIFGGGCEDNFNIPLIEGCEVLITTPHCLCRKLNKFVDFRRLNHLVIDEVETVMTNFREQIRTVMSAYREVLVARGSVTQPRQLLVFGTRWTGMVDSFWEAFMLEPILVITSQFEAAVYGGANHYTTMIHASQRLSKLWDLMDSLKGSNRKIIIFSSTDEEATTVHNMLHAGSCYVLLAIRSMDLGTVVKEWSLPHSNQSQPILVCTDEVVFDLSIRDADVIIHYGMAQSKTTFGNRLSCTQNYYRQLSGPKKPVKPPSSHIFVTETCGEVVLSLEEMLQRSHSKVPAKLRQMIAGMMESKEEVSKMPLCYYVKAFGDCKVKSRCDYRHQIHPELDKGRLLTVSAAIPKQGEVKVLVTYVSNASRIYVRILQHRALDGSCEEMDPLYNALRQALDAWYAIPQNQIENGPVQCGDLCCSPEDFCRVQVLSEGNYENYATERNKTVRVFYVDVGRREEVFASSLLKLPDKFKVVPFQAVETFMCRISPVDSDTDWVPRADTHMVDQVQDRQLWGKIVLSLGGTLWLDPLVERVYHKSINVTTTNTQIRTSMIRRGYAIDNPKHLELLYGLCKGKMELPDYKKNVLDPEPEVESLPETDEETAVYMSACDNPHHFYLQLMDTNKQLESLMNRLEQEAGNMKAVLSDRHFKAGALCLAIFSQDQRWYRGQILSVVSEDSAEVLFVDYGDKEVVERLHIKDIPEEVLRLPFQAIECELHGVEPRGGEWSDANGDALWDMTHHFDGDRRKLWTKVKGTRPAEYTGAYRYQVDLVYNTCDEDVHVLPELVYSKHLVTSNDSVQPLFPEDPTDESTQPDQQLNLRIKQMAKTLYIGQNTLVQRSMLFQLQALLKGVVQRSAMDIGEESVACVWNLIRYTDSSTVKTTLLPTFTQLLHVRERELRSVLRLGFVRHLCTDICRNSDDGVRLTSVRSLQLLCHIPELKCYLFYEDQIEALVMGIKETDSIQLKASIIELLAQICLDSSRLIELVQDRKGVDVIYTEMSLHVESTELAVVFCQFLYSLSHDKANQYYSDFKKDGLLKLVVDLNRTTDSSQVIRWTSRLMHRLCEKSRRNKTLILEAGYVPVLKGLAERFPGLVGELSDQWNQVLTALAVKAPREHLSEGVAVVTRGNLSSTAQRNIGHGVGPPVCWSQNVFRILLSVQLRGVEEKTITYTEQSISFKAILDNKLYAFDFVLVGRIIPSKCRMEARGAEVLVLLRKEEKGRWDRLLKGKEKPPNLSLDYDRFHGSSSDSEDEPDSDDNHFVLKKSTRGKSLPARQAGEKKGVTNNRQFPSSSDDSDSDSLQEYDSDEFDIFRG